MQKYGFDEARPVLERASARETATRVAMGTVAAQFLKHLGIELVSHTVSIASVTVPEGRPLPVPANVIALDADPLRCFDRETSDAMVAEVDAAHKEGETLGGVVEVLAYGLPPGLGSYVHWDRRLDSRLAAALMGIQAIKGVEVGDGFLTAARRGSAAHDEIVKDADGKIIRTSNRAGGIEGGMSIGDVLRVRAAMKPIATVPACPEDHRRQHRRGGQGPPPALGRLCRAGCGRRRRGHGGAGPGRSRHRKVRRRLRGRDRTQHQGLPGQHSGVPGLDRPVVPHRSKTGAPR